MATGQDSGTTLMDLITSDPAACPPSSSPAAAPTTLGKPVNADRKQRKVTLSQIQNDTISAAKALNPVKVLPQRQRKKLPVSYAQLARSIHEFAATADQKSSQRKLVHHVFPKLAVYNSVDPSLAPSLLMLLQQCEDRNVLRYVYYYLARILADSGAQGLSAAGGIPTPNWDALADIDAVGGVTRADVEPRIVGQLSSEALNTEIEFHARRLAALKALSSASFSSSDILDKLYEIVFGILEKVGDAKQKRKKGIFNRPGGDKEANIQNNLQYAAISALRRLPLDPGNPAFLHRAIQGVSFTDPVAVRHSLAIISDIAMRDPYSVAMALGKLAQPGGALQDVLHLHDVLARVSLARLCYMISRARSLDERPDIKSQFNSILYQLLLDPSDRVCFEAILCVLGKFDNTERTEERAAGWIRLTREILKLPEAPSVASKDKSEDGLPPKPTKEKASKARRPQPLIKLVMRRLESSFRSFSRPVLHAAARVVQEMGKSRAAAYALGAYDVDEGIQFNTYAENIDSIDSDQHESQPEAKEMREGEEWCGSHRRRPRRVVRPVNADRKQRKVTLSQIQNDTISDAKALNPVKYRTTIVLYALSKFGYQHIEDSSCAPLAALKALSSVLFSSSDLLDKRYEIVFGILENVSNGMLDYILQANIQNNLNMLLNVSLERLPLDPGNPAFLHRANKAPFIIPHKYSLTPKETYTQLPPSSNDFSDQLAMVKCRNVMVAYAYSLEVATGSMMRFGGQAITIRLGVLSVVFLALYFMQLHELSGNGKE
ncbi:hypothetical protein KFK09_017053 [Dendrobium nobile]|uniref:Uncharacterized protein n=1 Tax=Dendrobium nobile TaxID=94219 RepID=A0A8T3B151_DENNO|nr:hypothetical protein KFK09_017053 [Dendrobium nobile]